MTNIAKERRAMRLAAELNAKAIEEARDLGRQYFHKSAEEMLAMVARHGATLYPDPNHQIAFLQGYIEARTQRDAFKRGE